MPGNWEKGWHSMLGRHKLEVPDFPVLPPVSPGSSLILSLLCPHAMGLGCPRCHQVLVAGPGSSGFAGGRGAAGHHQEQAGQHLPESPVVQQPTWLLLREGAMAEWWGPGPLRTAGHIRLAAMTEAAALPQAPRH